MKKFRLGISCHKISSDMKGFVHKVIVNGKLACNCASAAGWVRLYSVNNSRKKVINSVSVPLNTAFADKKIELPDNEYPANGIFCIDGEIKCKDPEEHDCCASLSGEAIYYWR